MLELETIGMTQNKDDIYIIGLTGNIACGKSTVSRILKKLGAIVIDADEIGKSLVKPGTSVYNEIKACFGNDFFSNDGEVDRKKLGDFVFSDRCAKEKLDHIMFPAIDFEIKRYIALFRGGKSRKIIIIDAALLIEAGWHTMSNEIWVVKADLEVQIERLQKRDGISREKALEKISSQMDQDRKLFYASKVIDNSNSLSDTEVQVEKYWKEV